MILQNHQQFASPEEALVHYGKKGMRWGFRKEEEPSGSKERGSIAKSSVPRPRTDAEKKAARRAMAKKAAIGAGVLTAVAGTAFVAYKLNQSGKLPISSIKKPLASDVKKIIHEQKDVIHISRGKHKATTFIKQGGTPKFFTEWENAFGKEVGDPNTHNAFTRLTSGKIAAAFADPEGRSDAAGRPIGHQVVIPRSMTEGIESIEDVKTKIWPQLKDAYDEFYKDSLVDPIRRRQSNDSG